MRKSFAVVIPSFNNAQWCRKNLDSVLDQDYPLFRVIYIDDASADDNANLIAAHLDQHARADRVTFLRNTVRAGAAANIDRAVRSCDPDEVVVLVDGDDFLAHPQVLARLNEIYQDPDVWVTWGQFTRFPHDSEGFCAPIPSEIVSANAFRDFTFVSSHLRTFYAGLYHRIRPIDVQDDSGQFFSTAGDVAHMFALLEMAGPRGRFVAEVLYLYNRENPINDDKVDRPLQLQTELAIRNKARYGRVASLTADPGPREFCFVIGDSPSLFETTGKVHDLDQRRQPFRRLRSVLNRIGYTVREIRTLADIENPHAIVVFDVRPDEIERLAQYPRELLTLVLWGDPISAPFNFDARYHQPFDRIYTWRSDLVDHVRYLKLHCPFLRPMIDDLVAFENRRLCTLIASNLHVDHPDELYSEERKLAEYLAAAEPDSFDLFGRGWSPEIDRNTQVIPKRVDRLRRYRFNFCCESVKGWNGFVTGKIFDSFEAGCVPIYWGAPDVAELIPADCFIAREQFDSNAALHAFLRNMPADVHRGYVERIRAFLSSPRAVVFSTEHLVRTFVGLIGRGATGHAPRVSSPDAVDSVIDRTV